MDRIVGINRLAETAVRRGVDGIRRAVPLTAVVTVVVGAVWVVLSAIGTAPWAGAVQERLAASNVQAPGVLDVDHGYSPHTTQSQWTCSAFGYLFQSPNGLSTPHDIYQVTFVTGAYSLFATTADDLNAVGFNTLDDYMYGWDNTTKQVVRIGSDGSLVALGVPTGMLNTPGTIGFNGGDFNGTGDLFMSASGSRKWELIDLAPGSSTYNAVTADGTLTKPPGVSLLPADWAYTTGAFYGMALTTSGPAELVEFTPTSETVSGLGAITGLPGKNTYGAAYVISAADVAAGDVVNTATASGTDPHGTPVDSNPSTVVTPTATAGTGSSAEGSEHRLTAISSGHGWWGPGGPAAGATGIVGGTLVVAGLAGVVPLVRRRRRTAR